ncbi:DNA-3-methyladenine glycosylase 1 [compost metagenome]
MRKRERYREVLDGFDPVKLSQMSDERIEELMLDAGIIRNRLKLKAVRRNAQAWLAVDNPAEWL